MFFNDNRVVMTLDAGGTNFVFSAIKSGQEIVKPFKINAVTDNLSICVEDIKKGFHYVKDCLEYEPSAISFAFPGPADYENGVIGDLQNFPSFRGGVPLGNILSNEFKIPVFINNDGNLFAYGEAMAGALPYINNELKRNGNSRTYRNLLGVTFGTGFGAGVVLSGRLLLGDNGTGGDLWCFRNKKYPECIAEESVSIRAVKRIYKKLSGDDRHLEPVDIFNIAEGIKEGHIDAAKKSFEELGEIAGDVIAQAITIVDGIVVIGGGLSGAKKYFMPALIKEMNSSLKTIEGNTMDRLQMVAYNLDDKNDLIEFLSRDDLVSFIDSNKERQNVIYRKKRIGVMTCRNNTSKSISLGAYIYALNCLDSI